MLEQHASVERSLAEDLSCTTVTYDTDKPADSITGLPPVKSVSRLDRRTTERDRRSEEKHLTRVIEDKSKQSGQVSTDSKRIDNTDAGKTVKSSAGVFANYMRGFVLGIITIFIVWLIIKLKK